MSGRRALLAATTGLLLLVLVPLGIVAPSAPAGAASSEDGAPAYSQTKRLVRTMISGGETLVVDERDVTVTVDRTSDLRGRERVEVAWSGAHPTGGRAASPFGEQGMAQEYPVVILQCRGIDDPSLPAEQQLSPSTCWTSTRQQRSVSLDDSAAVWRHDAAADDAGRAQKSGLAPLPPECGDVDILSTHVTPFLAANGTVFPSCTAETMAPEAAVGAAFPPAEQAAFTDLEGNGRTLFEVRSSVENESLGCSDQVRCSIVVVPIQGISCVDEDPECMKAGQFASGSGNFANLGVDLAVAPSLWWSPSNWNGRFSVPISFGLPPDACDVLDSRAPTGFYGSELMAQAALQWAPAYCLDEDRFKLQLNKMPDDAAFAQMEAGGGVAAFVSSEHEARGTDPVAYAPTAVTGFAIAYVVDRPDNAGEATSLRLTPRLLAKLLTQSYLGSERGRSHPGMETNPLSLNLDPEFQRLNPGLDTTPREAAATLLSLSESSDVVHALTAYIAQDDDATAFVDGKPDPWGMRVNPAYRKLDLPTAEWPLLDDFVPPSGLECYQQNPAPYFTQVAAPVTTLRKVAEAVLDAWPNVQTKCDRAVATDPWKIGRVDRQGVGTRFMLGVVSLGDARRFGLHEAALQTRGSTFVTPTDAALAKALTVAEPSEDGTGPFALDMADVVTARSAYPGTVVVYTAARTSGLDEADAAKVADFIEIATTEGQQRGFGNGQLPEGYLPLQRTGPTAALRKQAGAVAELIRAQAPVPETDEEDDDGSTEEDGGTTEPVTDGGVDVLDVPTDAPTDTAPATKERSRKAGGRAAEDREPAAPVAMPATELVSAPSAGRLIPILLGAAVAGVALGALARGLARRRRSW